MGDSINGLGTGGGNMMRMLGMATGLDVDGMVKKMLVGEQKKVDYAKQQKDTLVWKQEMYKDIIKDVKDLQDTYFNVTSKDCLTSEKNYFQFDISSDNSNVATATAGKGAIEGNYNMNVTSLAKSAKLEGKSLFNQLEVSEIEGKNLNINGQSLTEGFDFSKIKGNESELVRHINKKISELNLTDKLKASFIDEGNKKYIRFTKSTEKDVKVNGLGDIINIGDKTKLSELGINKDLSFSVKYNDKESASISLNGNDTIESLLNKINSDSKLKDLVKASFDESTGKIVIQSKNTGSTENINIKGDLSSLGFKENSAQGQDALIKVTNPDGTTVTMTQDKNNFSLNGTNFSIKSEGNTNLTVKKDSDKVFDRMVKFIDKYNTLIDKINTKLTERKEYKYKPLTETQKKDMKEDDIKAWEEKAKKGALRNDDNLQNLLQSLRGTFFKKVEGSKAFFGQSIGLDTEGKYTRAGQIKFSDGTGEKFKKMLNDNPEDIMKLFTQSYTLTDEDLKKSKAEQKEIMDKNSGIFQRIDNLIKDYVGMPGTILNNAILTKYANKQDDYSVYGGGNNTLPDQIYRQENRIKQLNEKMFEKQERLYKQFSRLEVAMNKYNAQAGWLAQQFGGGQ